MRTKLDPCDRTAGGTRANNFRSRHRSNAMLFLVSAISAGGVLGIAASVIGKWVFPDDL
jgi:hypothetical protein